MSDSKDVPQPPCIGNDPACPCQDGDLCHYKDSPDGKTKAMATQPTTCKWFQEDEDSEEYETQCGDRFTIFSDPPHSFLKFCCFCGKPAEVMQWEPEDENE